MPSPTVPMADTPVYHRRRAEFINDEARRERIAELLADGLSFRQIQDEIGWSRQIVCNDAKIILARIQEELQVSALEWVQVETKRLEFLWERLLPRLSAIDSEGKPDPDLKAVEIALKVMKRKSELLGLDRKAEEPKPEQSALAASDIAGQLVGLLAGMAQRALPPAVEREEAIPAEVTIEEVTV